MVYLRHVLLTILSVSICVAIAFDIVVVHRAMLWLYQRFEEIAKLTAWDCFMLSGVVIGNLIFLFISIYLVVDCIARTREAKK